MMFLLHVINSYLPHTLVDLKWKYWSTASLGHNTFNNKPRTVQSACAHATNMSSIPYPLKSGALWMCLWLFCQFGRGNETQQYIFVAMTATQIDNVIEYLYAAYLYFMTAKIYCRLNQWYSLVSPHICKYERRENKPYALYIILISSIIILDH